MNWRTRKSEDIKATWNSRRTNREWERSNILKDISWEFFRTGECYTFSYSGIQLHLSCIDRHKSSPKLSELAEHQKNRADLKLK